MVQVEAIENSQFIEEKCLTSYVVLFHAFQGCKITPVGAIQPKKKMHASPTIVDFENECVIKSSQIDHRVDPKTASQK